MQKFDLHMARFSIYPVYLLTCANAKEKIKLNFKVNQKNKLTDFSRVSVGECVHKQTNGSQAEALIVRRQGSLQLLIVDEAAVVPVGQLEARHDVRIRAGRETGRH